MEENGIMSCTAAIAKVDAYDLSYFYFFSLQTDLSAHTRAHTQNTHSRKTHQAVHTEQPPPQGNQQTKEIYKPETMAGIKI